MQRRLLLLEFCKQLSGLVDLSPKVLELKRLVDNLKRTSLRIDAHLLHVELPQPQLGFFRSRCTIELGTLGFKLGDSADQRLLVNLHILDPIFG